MMLSKFMTANSREAIAAPEMRASATMRSKDAVLFTVPVDRFAGSAFTVAMI